MEPSHSRRGSPQDVPAADFIPEGGGLRALGEAAAGCRGCPLYGPATQTVFGEGPRKARIVLVWSSTSSSRSAASGGSTRRRAREA